MDGRTGEEIGILELEAEKLGITKLDFENYDEKDKPNVLYTLTFSYKGQKSIRRRLTPSQLKNELLSIGGKSCSAFRLEKGYSILSIEQHELNYLGDLVETRTIPSAASFIRTFLSNDGKSTGVPVDNPVTQSRHLIRDIRWISPRKSDDDPTPFREA